jgi:hypothetical protein
MRPLLFAAPASPGAVMTTQADPVYITDLWATGPNGEAAGNCNDSACKSMAGNVFPGEVLTLQAAGLYTQDAAGDSVQFSWDEACGSGEQYSAPVGTQTLSVPYLYSNPTVPGASTAPTTVVVPSAGDCFNSPFNPGPIILFIALNMTVNGTT